MPDQVEQRATVPVSSVLPEFADAFPFEAFNRMQAETLPALLESEDNVVVSAPTASGKTAIAEVAICRTLRAGGTALFLAPLRALTNEKEREWERFEDLGYSVYVVTGERELHPGRAERADILVMTPEKADSATRKHDTSRYSFVTDVDCCVIDEVHLLDSDRRGAVLEVTVSRLRRLCSPRIVALSATMPNVDEVATWLDAPPATTFAFGDDYRPVALEAEVTTYSPGENAFADKYRRLYRTLELVEPHLREEGQALVFVASRQDAVRAAEAARDELVDSSLEMGARGDYDVHTEARELGHETLRDTVLDGVGFHHAGLSQADKERVESWFREGPLSLVFSTSTLAWGVNLPARCVVIRDTKRHDPLEGEVDVSPLDILQMLGRAGRPGYDDHGYAWVVADPADADKYRRLLADGTTIESRLATELDAHLNAEIAMGTVTDPAEVRDWLATTFWAVRRGQGAEPEREARVNEALTSLVERGFVERTGETLEPTPLGRLASQYYVHLGTARRFADLAEGDRVDVGAVLRAVARAETFESVSARADESDAVDAVIGDDATELAPGQRKVLAICRAAMDGTTPSALASDAWVIRQNALRLLGACQAILARFGSARAANLASRVAARIETGVSADAVGLTAVDGIGATRAETLSGAGLATPAAIREAGVAGLTAAGLGEPVAERVVEAVDALPAVVVDWDPLPASIRAGDRTLVEVPVRSTAGDARAGLRVTVNGHEMTATETHLGTTVVPVALYGADEPALEIGIEVAFPDLPVRPFVASRSVEIRD